MRQQPQQERDERPAEKYEVQRVYDEIADIQRGGDAVEAEARLDREGAIYLERQAQRAHDQERRQHISRAAPQRRCAVDAPPPGERIDTAPEAPPRDLHGAIDGLRARESQLRAIVVRRALMGGEGDARMEGHGNVRAMLSHCRCLSAREPELDTRRKHDCRDENGGEFIHARNPARLRTGDLVQCWAFIHFVGRLAMAQDPLNLIWIDLEMTGLDTQRDYIIEIATVVTDGALNVLAEGPVIAIHQPDTVLGGMDKWNQEQHGKSGLIERVRASQYDEAEAERLTLEFLDRYVPSRASPMCGNSICQDRRFLARCMPQLERYFHYRNLDVSTVKELARRWAPAVFNGYTKQSNHLAQQDIHASIDELKYYREQLFRLPSTVNVPPAK